MNGRRKISCLVIVLTLTLLAGPSIQADPRLSDAAKMDAVYRMYADYKKDFPSVRDMAPAEAMARHMRGEIVFVDTRKPEEIAVSKLPAAITAEDFLTAPRDFAGQTVVAYCTISYRSGVFAREQAGQGVEVVNLQGGILAWVLEGGPVYDAEGRPTRRIHVYGDKWDLAPEGWESVKFGLWQKIF